MYLSSLKTRLGDNVSTVQRTEAKWGWGRLPYPVMWQSLKYIINILLYIYV